MRNNFFNLLKKQMHENSSIFLLAADMGLGLIENIQNEFPDRFLNVGIAEQNMIGIASGLCNLGFRPFCYTISNFLIHRAYEQIRNDICLHSYPITLIGTTTGFDNGLLGPTHQILDDIGCTGILPEIRIYSPSTVASSTVVFNELINSHKPAYVRIGKQSFDIDQQISNINGFIFQNIESDLLVITHGTILKNCIDAYEKCKNFSLYCMNRIKPFEEQDLKEILSNYSKVLVIEDHFGTSGLYAMLCQFIVNNKLMHMQMNSLAPEALFESKVGDNGYYSEKYGYSVDQIVEKIALIS